MPKKAHPIQIARYLIHASASKSIAPSSGMQPSIFVNSHTYPALAKKIKRSLTVKDIFCVAGPDLVLCVLVDKGGCD